MTEKIFEMLASAIGPVWAALVGRHANAIAADRARQLGEANADAMLSTVEAVAKANQIEGVRAEYANGQLSVYPAASAGPLTLDEVRALPVEEHTKLALAEEVIRKGVRELENLGAIAEEASRLIEERASEGVSISEEPIGARFSGAFTRLAKEAPDEEARTMWARVLAGETERPGSFSTKTLAVLDTLPRHVARTFEKFAKRRIDLLLHVLREQIMGKPMGTPFCVPDGTKGEAKVAEHGEYILMYEYGLVSPTTSQTRFDPNASAIENVARGYVVGSAAVVPEEVARDPRVTFQSFTTVGAEIAAIIPAETHEPTIAYLTSKLRGAKATYAILDGFELTPRIVGGQLSYSVSGNERERPQDAPK